MKLNTTRLKRDFKLGIKNLLLHKLRSLLLPFAPGPAQVRIRYRNATAECEMILGDAIRVRLDDLLLDALGGWLDPENVEIVYH